MAFAGVMSEVSFLWATASLLAGESCPIMAVSNSWSSFTRKSTVAGGGDAKICNYVTDQYQSDPHQG